MFSSKSRGGARLPEWLYGSSEKAERTHSMGNPDLGADVSYVLLVKEHGFLVV